MKKEEIKEYFDNFSSKNNTESTMYSYYYYFLNEFSNKNKEKIVINDDNSDSIMLLYKFQNKYKASYLPLIKKKIDQDYFKILNNNFLSFNEFTYIACSFVIFPID
jgi:hypothetical protein